MKQISIFIATAAIASSVAWSQSEITVDKVKLRAESMAGVITSARFGMMGPPVKGAPYSAEAVTEVTQTLADGTHINRQETYNIYRDGEGRIRRESGDQAWISDPVAGETYILDTKQQTARKMPLKGPVILDDGKMQLDTALAAKIKAEGMAGAGINTVRVQGGVASGYTFRFDGGEGPGKTESLGKQEMEGGEVEGTRNTTVIPQGQIGNDRPLQMVHERWESSDLHVTILAKHTDPMVGDRVERLTNVRRGEPDPALFQVPAGYQVLEKVEKDK